MLPLIPSYQADITSFLDDNESVDFSNLFNFSLTNSGKLCCPDCKNGIYYLGNKVDFASLVNENAKFCCIEYIGTGISTTLNCCGTDFLNSIQNWLEFLGTTGFSFSDVNNVVESSSFNGFSGLGLMFDYLQLNQPNLDPTIYLFIITAILYYGVVIECVGCKMNFYTFNILFIVKHIYSI
jgi:hypothetical protein